MSKSAAGGYQASHQQSVFEYFNLRDRAETFHYGLPAGARVTIFFIEFRYVIVFFAGYVFAAYLFPHLPELLRMTALAQAATPTVKPNPRFIGMTRDEWSLAISVVSTVGAVVGLGACGLQRIFGKKKKAVTELIAFFVGFLSKAVSPLILQPLAG